MRYLLDTTVIIRLPHRADPQHHAIRDALRALMAADHVLVTSTQNIAEFWNVCTRPATARGGFGLSIEETARRLRLLERFIQVLREPDSAYKRWKRLVTANAVQGRQVHDARIAALMGSYRIRRILTFNTADFKRYKGIEALAPQDILA